MAGEMAVYGLKYRYARIAGDIETINAENAKIEAQIESLRSRHERNVVQICALTVDLQTVESASALAFQVDLKGTAPRKRQGPRHTMEAGGR
jgi:hypothetical protein